MSLLNMGDLSSPNMDHLRLNKGVMPPLSSAFFYDARAKRRIDTAYLHETWPTQIDQQLSRHLSAQHVDSVDKDCLITSERISNPTPQCTNQEATVPTKNPRAQRSPPAKRKASCPICKSVMLRKTLQRHIDLKHNNRLPILRCSSCVAQFKRKDVLERHEREQHGDHPRTVTCSYCGRQVRERALNDHFKSRKCRVAGVVAKSKSKAQIPKTDAQSDCSGISAS